MTMKMRWLGVFAIVVAGGVAAGCASEESSPKGGASGRVQTELAKENGGLTTSAEPAAFGDATLAAAPIFTPVGPEPIVIHPGNPGSRNYRLALVWGHLPTGEPAPATRPIQVPRSWDIRLSVRGGSVVAYRTLSAGEGNVTLSNPGPTELQLLGRTSDGYAGAILALSVDASLPASLFVNVEGASSRELTLETLEETGGGSMPLGDGVHGLKWAGFPYERSCVRGFGFGDWAEEEGHAGTLMGQTLDVNGARNGWLRGLWGYSRGAHQPLFVAKRIDQAGAFGGIANGTFLRGHFEGKWTSRDEAWGGTQGVYGDPKPGAPPRGMWLGTWGKVCPK